MSMAFDVAGALPASSFATMTIGSANVYVALTERWPWRSWICAGSSPPWPGARVVAFRTVSVTSELISWITEPASFVTLTLSVNGSPARAVVARGEDEHTRERATADRDRRAGVGGEALVQVGDPDPLRARLVEPHGHQHLAIRERGLRRHHGERVGGRERDAVRDARHQ